MRTLLWLLCCWTSSVCRSFCIFHRTSANFRNSTETIENFHQLPCPTFATAAQHPPYGEPHFNIGATLDVVVLESLVLLLCWLHIVLEFFSHLFTSSRNSSSVTVSWGGDFYMSNSFLDIWWWLQSWFSTLFFDLQYSSRPLDVVTLGRTSLISKVKVTSSMKQRRRTPLCKPRFFVSFLHEEKCVKKRNVY